MLSERTRRPRTPARSMLLSCGEPSGDLYAGALTRELRALVPDLTVAGLGGPQFAAAGGRLIDDYRGLAVTGLTEALAKLPKSAATLRRLVAYARDERPDALVVIDFPDFNLRLARAVRKLGIPVIYYIARRSGRGGRGRLKTIRAGRRSRARDLPVRRSDLPQGRRAGRVRRPSAGRSRGPRRLRATDFLTGLGLDPIAPTVAVLPGSRPNEVSRILPDLLAACRLIADACRACSSWSPARRISTPRSSVRPIGATGLRIAVVEGETDAVLASADVALTASGTATVQAALHDMPMVVVYRLSPLTYRLGRRLVKVDTFAMVNLIAGERIVPELIQDAFTPEAVADEATSMLTDGARARTIREGLRACARGSAAPARAGAPPRPSCASSRPRPRLSKG